ncbi:hypothetical protein [Rhodohalobacter halophilus]|uniref:hypothetical protein n=1 Tax=Rhodohalobacter halophilus TaxID=1812810 RepID=UPI00083FB6FD|nr:hypothetical protein [Rhodohalobacter halophilus]
MGQQQLLLVILVTIIVGIATVVAINTFGTAADSATLDGVRQDLTSLSASAQGYYMKPEMLGGGGRSFDGLTFRSLTFSGDVIDDFTATNEYGTYIINSGGAISGTAQEFVVEATANVSDSTKIQVRVCPDGQVMGTPDGTAGACPS